MLDIKFIRENKDVIIMGAKKKHLEIDIDALIILDDRRKALQTSIEAKRAEQNAASNDIAGAINEVDRQQRIIAMQKIKEAGKKEEEELKHVLEDWRALMVRVPNIPDMSVP